MAGRRVVAVAGTHGKTTTTSLLTVALAGGRRRPDVRHRRRPRRDRQSTRPRAPATCSSPRPTRATAPSSHYAPYAAIVTNVEADHLDHWETEEAYARGVRRVRGHRRPRRASWSAAWTTRARPRWPSAQRAAGRRVRDGVDRGRAPPTSGRRRWPASSCWSPGDHYLADALLALAAGRELGLRRRRPASAGIASFTGTRRRMERKGEAGGVRVYDSYAHHPTEIAGDLAAARALAGDGRLVVAFQPHLVSRTRTFGAGDGRGARRGRRGRGLRRLPGPRGRRPRGDRCAGRGRRTAAARAGRLRARPRRRPGRPGRPGAARRPGADPRRRQRHRGRPAGAGAARR